ncbi:MAG: hypothetical protein GYA36_19715 [Veillonellaceae bacterium]|nr:hypothetical protein [Veillonellaceae bacterium]
MASLEELPSGKILVRSICTQKIPGPAQSFSSTEYGYQLEIEVERDDLIVHSAARILDELVDELNAARRKTAYAELIKALNKLERDRFREETGK